MKLLITENHHQDLKK